MPLAEAERRPRHARDDFEPQIHTDGTDVSDTFHWKVLSPCGCSGERPYCVRCLSGLQERAVSL